MEAKDLIEQIINELVNPETPLSSILLKTKVLASRIQNEELRKWVNNEFDGYSFRKDVPEYRKYEVIVEGDFIIGRMKYTNHVVPTNGLDDFLTEDINFISLQHSVSTLEKMMTGSNVFTIPFTAEVMSTIAQNWQSYNDHLIHLYSCRQKVSIVAVHQTISMVRNRLLNFMLKIDEEFGNLSELELKNSNNQITTLVHQIITISGDGNVVNTGNDANIKTTISVTKGSKEELEKYMESIGVPKEDVSELIKVIDSDKPDEKNKSFGTKVYAWIGKILTKTADTSAKVATSAGGNLLASGIKAYYGWG